MESKEAKIRELKKSIKPSKYKKGRVSVIIPFYGYFDERRVFLTIDSIKTQKNIDLEIILSEQGATPKLEGKLESVKYIFRRHKSSPALSDFRPGLTRNLAAELSTGEFLYTNDADIVFLNPRYLESLIELLNENKQLVLYRPPMRRLLLENFEEFRQRVISLGITNAIGSLDFSQQYLATTDGKKSELKVVTRQRKEYEKTFTASMENFRKYINDPLLKGKEPLIWSENLHCGGTFMRKEQFDLVGGYCEEFINWGCEDSDLQWKLGKCFNLQKVPYQPEFEVLHLDHPKNYFSGEMWAKNERLSEERKKQGIVCCALHDLKQRAAR